MVIIFAQFYVFAFPQKFYSNAVSSAFRDESQKTRRALQATAHKGQT